MSQPQTLTVRFFPDPILRRKCLPITDFKTQSLSKLIMRMGTIMRSQRHGIGIAAPQIGVDKQVALVDVSSRQKDAKRLILVNPVILEASIEKPSREGCMSLPDYTAQIKRYEKINLRWQDETGRFLEQAFEGIEAVCIQHEVDHLQGILFIDRVISLKRDLIPRPKQF